MQEEENFKSGAALSRPMARNQTTRGRGWVYDCEAVIDPKTAIVISYGDDGTPNCLCDCCAVTAGYLRP